MTVPAIATTQLEPADNRPGPAAGAAQGSIILQRAAKWRPDAVSVLTIFVVLLLVVPARNTFAALGPAGRPTFLFGCLLVVVWACTRLHPKLARTGLQPIRFVLLVYFCVQLAAYVAGLQRGLDGLESRATTRSIMIVVAMIGVTLAAADGIPSRERLETLLARIIYCGAIMSIFGVLQYIFREDYTRYLQLPFMQWASGTGVGSRGAGVIRVSGTATHYIEFGTVAALVFPLGVYRTLHASTRGARQRAACATAILAIAVPLSVSRTAVLSFVCVLLMQLALWGWRRRLNVLSLLLVGTAAFSAVVPGVLGTLSSLFRKYEEDPSYKGRIADYELAKEFISERPWLGRGPGTFMPERYFFLDNQYLGTLITSGYIGLAVLILTMLTGLLMARRVSYQATDEATRDLGQAFAAIVIAAAFASYWFDSFGFAAFGGYFFLMIGVIGALWRIERERRQITTPSKL